MKKYIIKLFIVALLSISAGCTGYRPAPDAFHEALNKPYAVDSGDILRVTVFEQESLTNTYSIDQGGHIAFPLIGAVDVRGHTTKQVEKTITAKLGNGFLLDPDVTVEVDRYRPVFIMGEVGAPGQYSYVPGMTTQKAIAAAGGFTPRAEQTNVDVTREVDSNVMTARVVITDPLLPGDTIYVRERLF